jgi:predicted transcriptional regulator
LIDLDTEVEINTVWEKITENIKISARESVGYCEMNQHNHALMKDAQNHYNKGNKLNSSGYGIQVKQMGIT